MTALRIDIWRDLDAAGRRARLARPATSLDPAMLADVRHLLDTVRQQGDQAVRRLTRTFDKVDIAVARVAEADLARAWSGLGAREQAALAHAKRNIEAFHRAQRAADASVQVETGVRCWQMRRPIDAVGLYVPGGTAPLPSAVLMLALPAAIAGCERRVLCTPPQRDGKVAPAVLAAAELCGVTEVFAIGGAQAIAALAYGTASLPPVRKIYGPGNAYVTAAKMLVSQDPAGAACDLPAGPSEVLVIADDGADPTVVAADLLAQAEHGRDSQAMLFTDSVRLAGRVADAIATQVPERTRADIIRAALANSACVVFDSLDAALAVSNDYAPEHLLLNTRDAAERVAQVTSAGSVFVGPWAAESFGDYCSGTNHVLPTYGFAHACSGLGVADFEKTISVQTLDATGFDALADTAATLARMEGLDAHAAAVDVRRTLRRQRGAA